MKKTPPVPPANRTPKGPGSDPASTPQDENAPSEVDSSRGQRDNVEQNTHNQGYQQDR